MQGWDLNLTTSGLWARRATKLLYPAIFIWELAPFCTHGGGAGDRSRTGTILSYHGILSPGRLPIPPHRQLISPSVQIIISQIIVLVNPQFSIFLKNIFLFFDKLQSWRPLYRRMLIFIALTVICCNNGIFTLIRAYCLLRRFSLKKGWLQSKNTFV